MTCEMAIDSRRGLTTLITPILVSHNPPDSAKPMFQNGLFLPGTRLDMESLNLTQGEP
jgi:hypothetical protein